MLNELKFDKEFVSNIKKNIINYVSRASVNVNKITFNLTLYTNFIVNNDDTRIINITLPVIKDGKIIPASIEIGGSFFNVMDNNYYIKPELEDIFINKLTRILVYGASINIKYNHTIPLYIESVGLGNMDALGDATNTVIAEDINNYVIPEFDDQYVFNKQIVRMINAIIGEKYSVSTYFNHDKAFEMMIYSLSNDNEFYNYINSKLNLIKQLINTLNSKESIKTDTEKEIIEKLIRVKERHLLNELMDKLYIPYINSVGFDSRKMVRDEILKGFLGINYANQKLTKDNKESYYFASLITNTIPINNKVTDQSKIYFEEQIEKDACKEMHDIYVIDALYKAKNNVKEFFVFENGNYIKTNNGKIIKEKNLVNEILSYAYINSVNSDICNKIEAGIVKLASSKEIFTCTLKHNTLVDKMLVATIIKLANKNGYELELMDINNNIAKFKVLNKKEV